MKLTGILCFWLTAMAALAQSHPGWEIYRNPLRVFKGQGTVDLTPLYEWWKQAELAATNRAEGNAEAEAMAERPLTNWFRLSGTKIALAGNGSWVADATIYTAPTIHTKTRIILNNPPAVEEQTYYYVKTQLAEATRELTQAQTAYAADTNAVIKAREDENAYRHSPEKIALTEVKKYARLAVEKQQAAASTLNQIEQLKPLQTQLASQLTNFPAVDGTYRIDWFAVSLGRTRQGVPVFDLGLVVPAAH